MREQLLHSQRVQTMKTLIVTSGLIAALTLAGCATEPKTFGDQLSNRADQANDIGKQWNNSNEGVIKGEKMITKGQGIIEEAKNSQLKGEQMIEDGRKQVDSSKQQMLNSEADYQKMRQTPVPLPESKY